MATALKPCGKHRNWNPEDSEDPSDIRRLYESDPPKTLKPGKCISTWTFSLLILAVSVLFLMGLFIGFYVRESQTTSGISSCKNVIERKDNLDMLKLESVHENHMYFLSGENVMKYIREFSTGEPELTDTNWDKTVINRIKTDFNNFGFDRVNIQNHDIVVTYPDPKRPNHLEIISSSGNVELNVSLGSIEKDRDDHPSRKSAFAAWNISSSNRVLYPYVAFSPPGVVQGEVVYGHYGDSSDFLHLWTAGIQTKGRILLLRLGQISVGKKVELASEVGATCVLLYWDPVDVQHLDPHPSSRIPYSSAGDYGQPLIPIQTISMEIAEDLLQRMSGLEAPVEWQGGLNTTYRHVSNTTDHWKVKMSVYNQKNTARVTNVIGSIHGNSEPDRYVLIGASRTAFPSENSDTKSSMAILVEIGHRLAQIQKLEGWRPQRGIKLCSWGGNELSHAGLRGYIQNKKHILMQKAVAYIDLDRLVEGTEFVQFTTSYSLVDLVVNAANRVPDANTPTSSVSELWLNRADVDPLINFYNGYPEQLPFLHSAGVPVLKIQYKGNAVRGAKIDANKLKDILIQDSQHHFRYHLTAARVSSLMLLQLADDIILPHNVMTYTRSIQTAVDNTITKLKLYPALTNESLDEISEDAATLARAGGAYRDFTTDFHKTFDILALRKVNDLLIIFDKFFVIELPDQPNVYLQTCLSSKQRKSQHMLYRRDSDQAMLLFLETAEISKSTNNWSSLIYLLQQLRTALQEAHSSLQSEDS